MRIHTQKVLHSKEKPRKRKKEPKRAVTTRVGELYLVNKSFAKDGHSAVQFMNGLAQWLAGPWYYPKEVELTIDADSLGAHWTRCEIFGRSARTDEPNPSNHRHLFESEENDDN